MKPLKPIAVSLLMAGLICCQGQSAYAEDTITTISSSKVYTTISTYVPAAFSVELEFQGESGAVRVNGLTYQSAAYGGAESASIPVECCEEQSYYLIPDDGNRLGSLIYNGEDVTNQVHDNIFTAPEMDTDGIMVVTFVPAEEAPEDRSYTVQGATITIGAVGGTLAATGYKGRTKKNNEKNDEQP